MASPTSRVRSDPVVTVREISPFGCSTCTLSLRVAKAQLLLNPAPMRLCTSFLSFAIKAALCAAARVALEATSTQVQCGRPLLDPPALLAQRLTPSCLQPVVCHITRDEQWCWQLRMDPTKLVSIITVAGPERTPTTSTSTQQRRAPEPAPTGDSYQLLIQFWQWTAAQRVEGG